MTRRRGVATLRTAPLVVVAALLLGPSQSAAAPGADLVVTAASKPPESVVQGSRVKLRVAVANRAGSRTGGSRVGLYLSSNARWSSSDFKLPGSAAVRALGSRRRATVRVALRMPRDAPPAQRLRLLACADAGHAVLEANEQNNCRVAGSLIVVGGSSFEVIDAYVKLHRLKASRAVLYKLFAVFGDRRLARRYRGDGSRVSGTSAVREAMTRLRSLPRAIRAQVRPFLVPPAYRGSFADGTRIAQRDKDDVASDFDNCTTVRLSDWTSVETAGARVWWRTSSSDATNAQRLAQALEGPIWTALTAVMGRGPLSDTDYRCGGADGKYDVYLWPTGNPKIGVTRAFSSSCAKPQPSYTIVDPRAPRAVLAHEFMHVLQFTYPRAGKCDRWDYLDDATASWAEDRAYHGDQTEHQYKELVEGPLVVFGYGDGYPGWAFMLSATKHGTIAAVPRLFQLGGTHADPLDALDGALPGGLERAWPTFAKEAWNRALLPGALKESFFNWDAWRVRPKVPQVPFRLRARRWEGPLPIELAGLTRQYLDLDFTDRTARELRFKDPSAAGADPQLRTWAFLKIARRGWRSENWSGRDEVVLCRDLPEEDVRQVVIVHSTTKRPPPGDPARTVTQSDKPKLRLKDRCEAEASLTLGGRQVYTVQHADCKPTERTVMSWQLNASFDLPGKVARGAPDPVETDGGAGSGSLEIDEVDPDVESECPPLKHSTHLLEWQGGDGLTLRLLRKGHGIEVEVRMVYGFVGVGERPFDEGILGLGVGPDPFEDGVCKEIHGTIADSKLRDRRITVPLSGTCDVRFGPEDRQHSISQANGTLVITQ